MSDPVKHTPKFKNKVITPIGRASFPAIVKPDDYKGKVRYKCSLLIPKNSPDFEAFRNTVNAFAKEVFPNVTKKNYGNPIADGDLKTGKNAEHAKGHWIINAKSVSQPAIVGPGGKADPLEPTAVVGGKNCRLKVSLMSFVGVDKERDDNGNVQTVTTYGVTLLLDAIQMTGGGQPFGRGGGDADGFDAVSPGEVGDAGDEEAPL